MIACSDIVRRGFPRGRVSRDFSHVCMTPRTVRCAPPHSCGRRTPQPWPRSRTLRPWTYWRDDADDAMTPTLRPLPMATVRRRSNRPVQYAASDLLPQSLITTGVVGEWRVGQGRVRFAALTPHPVGRMGMGVAHEAKLTQPMSPPHLASSVRSHENKRLSSAEPEHRLRTTLCACACVCARARTHGLSSVANRPRASLSRGPSKRTRCGTITRAPRRSPSSPSARSVTVAQSSRVLTWNQTGHVLMCSRSSSSTPSMCVVEA